MTWKPLPYATKAEEAALLAETKKKACFLIDENVDPVVTDHLREEGWNVKDVREVGLAKRDDEEVLALAHREDRVLLTHDTDFLDDRRFPPHRNPGIAVLPSSTPDFGAFAGAVEKMLLLVGTSRHFQRGTKVVFARDGSLLVRSRHQGKMTETRYRFTRSGPAEIWENES